MAQQPTAEQLWHAILTGTHPDLRRGRHFNKLIPSNPRCKFCNTPFGSFGLMFTRLNGKRPSAKNPTFCDLCEQFAKTHPGGAEIELTMLFADVRGSTTLAERMSASAFSRLMNRFYVISNRVLVKTDAWIDKLVGDEVIGLYLPGFAGPNHAGLAVQAARELLHATGHADRGEPWLPVGAGIHTGVAFIGAVGSVEGATDVTALGDAVNITARLASQAAAGEILISEAASTAARVDRNGLESRRLELKGRAAPVDVSVLCVRPA